MFIRFDRIHERDGQTDRQTPHDDIGRAYASHRAAKIMGVAKFLWLGCQVSGSLGNGSPPAGSRGRAPVRASYRFMKRREAVFRMCSAHLQGGSN